MPIIEFDNDSDVPVTLVVEPQGERYEIPGRSAAGVRYVVRAGAEDRSHVSVSSMQVEFWSNADRVEIEMIHPWPCERLSRDICVGGGWCGGIVNDTLTHFQDLLPDIGAVSARAFAELVIRAEGWPEGDVMPEKHLRWLEAKFVEHMGAEAIDVTELRRLPVVPFATASS